MQVVIFEPSTTTNPLGMLLAGGDSRVVCSADLSLACSTDGSSRCVASRIPLRCLWHDAPTHDHHRRSAAAALQFGAFAQWRLHGWLHARRAGRHRAGLEPHPQQRQPLAVLAIGMSQAKVARAPKPLGQDVLQHQPQKVRSADGARRVLAAATVAIAERDLTLRTAHDVTLLNHAPVQVAPQIDQCLVPIAHALACRPPSARAGRPVPPGLRRSRPPATCRETPLPAPCG